MSATPIFSDASHVVLFWWLCYLFFNIQDLINNVVPKRSDSNNNNKDQMKNQQPKPDLRLVMDHAVPNNKNDIDNQRVKDILYHKTVAAIQYYPPAWLFGVVWPILYILLIAATLIYYRELNTSTAGVYYDISTISIFLNFMLNKGWFPLFFKKKMYLLAALTIAAMLITCFITLVVVACNDVLNHWVVFALFLIYELWCCFALILNVDFYIKEKKFASEYLLTEGMIDQRFGLQ